MKPDKQTTKAFYKHSESGQILVIERNWNGDILGSCKASEPLKNPSGYECTNKNNVWLQENSDKLILM